jgi:centromeric protein E
MSGITEYAVADIFNYIEKVYKTEHIAASPFHFENLVLIRFFLQHKEREFVLKFSAMEIYNESVRDLLSTDTTPLRLLDDPEVNIFPNFSKMIMCMKIC